MTEPTREITPPRPASRTYETYREVLESLNGQLVTMVNPESYEDAALGHHLTTGFYRAKVLNVGVDVLTIATEYKH